MSRFLRLRAAAHTAIAAAIVVASSAVAAPAMAANVPCTAGFAGSYQCENVDLNFVLPTASIGLGTVSDLWGWTDPETGQEWALTTTGYGIAFIDVTDPDAPRIAARSTIQQISSGELWRDVKVYKDHAFVVAENGSFGIRVYDLTKLRDITGSVPTNGQFDFQPETISTLISSAHNIVINEETGYAFAVGADTCDGGLHFINIDDPVNPVDAGCFAEDGYTHDAQCKIYRGEDVRYNGREICFASNEDYLTIVDVTDKSAPKMLSTTTYPTAAYTHQGWQTPDDAWHIFGDEVDEQPGGTGTVPATTTYILETRDLENPGVVKAYTHSTQAIDHNLYVVGDLVYQANYDAGLRILRWTEEGLQNGELEPVAYFDAGQNDQSVYSAAWTAYPFFESGTVILSSFEAGLFILTPTIAPAPVAPPAPPAPEPEPEPAPEPAAAPAAENNLPTTGGGLALLGLLTAGGALTISRRRIKS